MIERAKSVRGSDVPVAGEAKAKRVYPHTHIVHR